MACLTWAWASRIVIVPLQTTCVRSGHVTGISATPCDVTVADLADMTTGGGDPADLGVCVGAGVGVGVGEGVGVGVGVGVGAGAGVGAGGDPTDTVRVVWALGPPLRLTVWPVKTCVVDVPAVSVAVSVAV
jgi:hypothetical protein